jgi:23S rRNA (guanosine2251-2'-O)-methyltransferase
VNRDIYLIIHNVRSTHNVGSLLRTAEGIGVRTVFFTGYTPFPHEDGDQRLPHIANKLTRQIEKTALGAEKLITWQSQPAIALVCQQLQKQDVILVGLEQSPNAVDLPTWSPPDRIAIFVGNERDGLDQETLQLMDQIVAIPMLGKKESFNVVQAAAMALYHCRF